MSETINNIISHSITAPSINDVNYASALNDVFDNINDNFVQLANHDFVKGDAGNSVIIKEADIVESYDNTGNPIYTELGNKLVTCITNTYSSVELANITHNGNTISVWDNFKQGKNPGKIQMVYNLDTIDGVNIIETPVSSLYYVFLDGRYANSEIGKIDESKYQSIIDTSCIMIFDGTINDFKILANAFPTIYYEAGVGLCWKINGNGTGIPVQGIKGRDGIDTKLFIVKGNNVTSANTNSTLYNAQITHIFDGKDGYSTVEAYLNTNDILKDHEYTALIFCTNPGDNTNLTNGVYFGTIKYEKLDSTGYKLNGYFDTVNSIDTTIQAEAVINVFKSINLTNTATGTMPGVFIPIEKESDNDTQKVHLLSATSITNKPGDTSELNNDLILTPVNNINGLAVSDEVRHNLKVEKYLYIKLDKNKINDFLKGYSDMNIACYKRIFEKYNYIFKYKLYKSVNKINENIFKYITYNTSSSNNFIANIYNDSYRANNASAMGMQDSTTGMCFYIKVPSSTSEEPNYEFVKGEKYTADNFNHLINSLPQTFYEKLNPDTLNFSQSLYCWELDFSYDDFDPDELKNSIAGSNGDNEGDGNFKFDEDNGKKYYHVCQSTSDYKTNTINIATASGDAKTKEPAEFEYEFTQRALTAFKTLFTLTMSPTFNTDFLWFNGLSYKYVNFNVKHLNSEKTDIVSIDEEPSFNKEYIFDVTDKKTDGTIIIRNIRHGFDYDNTNIFSFEKYVPIFNNDYAIDDDTVLNVNYNINITGDENHPTKSLSINGDIKCENLQVYSMSAADEIKNIYTRDNIISEQGLIVGYTPESTYTDTDGDGNTVTVESPASYSTYLSNDGTIVTNNIYANTLDSANVLTNTLNTSFVQITSENNISPTDITANVLEGKISASNTNKITLLRPLGPETYIETSKASRAAGNLENFESYIPGELNGSINIGGSNISNSNSQIGSGISNGSNSGNNSNTDNEDYFDNLDSSNQSNSSNGSGTTDGTFGNGYNISNIPNYKIKPSEDNATILAANHPEFTTTIPINSRNTPIFVSNTNIASQQLCASGISRNYFDGTKLQAGHGMNFNNNGPTSHDYVCNTHFDDVKDFNINRASFEELSNNSENNVNRLNLDFSTPYENRPTDSDRLVLGSVTFSETDDYNKTFNGNVNLEKYCILKNSIQKGQNDYFDFTKNITININSTFNTLIAFYGETSYGGNPILRDASNIKINLIYECTKTGKDTIKDTILLDTFYAPATTFGGGNSYRTETDTTDKTNDYRFVKISTNTWGNYDYNWRYRSFFFNLSSYTISKSLSNTSHFYKIATAYNDGYKIKFYIVPEIYILVGGTKNTWGNWADCVKGILVTVPAPVKERYTGTAEKLIDKNYISGTYNNALSANIKFNYNTITTGNGSGIKASTLTDNGIVFRDGSHVFGLGYSTLYVDYKNNNYGQSNPGEGKYQWAITKTDDKGNIVIDNEKFSGNQPVLFYYDNYYNNDLNQSYYENNNGIITPTGGNNTQVGIAARTHVIPLKDIFNTIKYIRKTQSDWVDYGL